MPKIVDFIFNNDNIVQNKNKIFGINIKYMNKRPNSDTYLEDKRYKTEDLELGEQANELSEQSNELSEEDQLYFDLYSLLIGYDYDQENGTFIEGNNKLKKGYKFWNDIIFIIADNWDDYNSQWPSIKTRFSNLEPTLLEFLQDAKPRIEKLTGDTIVKIPFNVLKIIRLFSYGTPDMRELNDSIVSWIDFFNSSNNPGDSNYSELSQQDGGKRRKTKKTKKIKTNRKRKWSLKYKKSINCRRPKGFSQKQYCKYGRKK